MKLFLMRHGDALDGFRDALRPLSPRGESEAKRAGDFLNKIEEHPDLIYHSTLLRSRQTAEKLADRIGAKHLHECDGLLPGDSPRNFARELSADLGADLLVVGHLPFLGELASLLLSGDEAGMAVRFTTGSLIGLARAVHSPLWTLRFHIPAKQLSRLI